MFSLPPGTHPLYFRNSITPAAAIVIASCCGIITQCKDVFCSNFVFVTFSCEHKNKRKEVLDKIACYKGVASTPLKFSQPLGTHPLYFRNSITPAAAIVIASCFGIVTWCKVIFCSKATVILIYWFLYPSKTNFTGSGGR